MYKHTWAYLIESHIILVLYVVLLNYIDVHSLSIYTQDKENLSVIGFLKLYLTLIIMLSFSKTLFYTIFVYLKPLWRDLEILIEGNDIEEKNSENKKGE